MKQVRGREFVQLQKHFKIYSNRKCCNYQFQEAARPILVMRKFPWGH